VCVCVCVCVFVCVCLFDDSGSIQQRLSNIEHEKCAVDTARRLNRANRKDKYGGTPWPNSNSTVDLTVYQTHKVLVGRGIFRTAAGTETSTMLKLGC
jgi:hypothetical protein